MLVVIRNNRKHEPCTTKPGPSRRSGSLSSLFASGPRPPPAACWARLGCKACSPSARSWPASNAHPRLRPSRAAPPAGSAPRSTPAHAGQGQSAGCASAPRQGVPRSRPLPKGSGAHAPALPEPAHPETQRASLALQGGFLNLEIRPKRRMYLISDFRPTPGRKAPGKRFVPNTVARLLREAEPVLCYLYP